MFVLDKSGDVEPSLNANEPFGDEDRLLASGIFALCGLDHDLDVGRVHWMVVARVYEDELDLFETHYDLQDDIGADAVSDMLHDLVVDGDMRLAGLPGLGPQ